MCDFDAKEVRTMIKMCHASGQKPSEARETIKNITGKPAVCRSLVYKWYKPYSPDLAPMDFDIFPRIKKELRGVRHESVPDLIRHVHRIVRGLDSQYFQDVFAKWVIRHRKCVDSAGVYFEKL